MSVVYETLEPVQKNQLVLLAQLFPYAGNYQQHPPEQLRTLKESLKRFGQVRSIVVRDEGNGSYTIIAGHGIVLAAQSLAEKSAANARRFGSLRCDLIPSSWPMPACEAYLVADNEINKQATQDQDLFAKLLQAQSSDHLLSVGSSEQDRQQLLRAIQNSHAADFLHDTIASSTISSPSFAPSSPAAAPTRMPSLPAPLPSPSVEEDKQWFPVTYTMSREQRDILLAAIKKAKEMWGVETSAEALVQICSQYVRSV